MYYQIVALLKGILNIIVKVLLNIENNDEN
jgi:hypothetical protein